MTLTPAEIREANLRRANEVFVVGGKLILGMEKARQEGSYELTQAWISLSNFLRWIEAQNVREEHEERLR
jgi:hypothetical protein